MLDNQKSIREIVAPFLRYADEVDRAYGIGWAERNSAVQKAAENPDKLYSADGQHWLYTGGKMHEIRYSDDDLQWGAYAVEDDHDYGDLIDVEVSPIRLAQNVVKYYASKDDQTANDETDEISPSDHLRLLQKAVVNYLERSLNEINRYRVNAGMGDKEINLMINNARSQVFTILKAQGWEITHDDYQWHFNKPE